MSYDNRAGAGIAAGDEVEVVVELDTQPREVGVPDDFSAALAAAPDAGSFFEGLSFSKKQRFVLNIEGAKTPETRERRIAKAVERLRDRRAQG